MIEVKNVSKKYFRGDREFKVFEDVSFSAEEGDFLLVSGVSGSGKSTLLAVAAGFLHPDRGQVLFEDKDISSLKDKELSRLHNSWISYVPQSNIMLGELTVLENLLLPFSISKKTDKNKIQKALQLLKTFGLEGEGEKYPFELSGGQLRRSVLARALIVDPEVIVCDEITNGLDEATSRIVLDYLKAYAEKGNCVIAASHDPVLREYTTREIKCEV